MCESKIAIRRAVLDKICNARVFDAFAGSGVMYRSVWSHAAEYVGCDFRFFRDDRTAFVADNRRVMRSIDLSAFNIFDFDAYGSPWEQCIILAARRKVASGERIGLVMTEGSRMKMTFGGMPKIIADLAGAVGNYMSDHPGASRDINAIIDRAIAEFCRRWGVRLERQWRSESKSVGQARPLYIGMILVGI